MIKDKTLWFSRGRRIIIENEMKTIKWLIINWISFLPLSWLFGLFLPPAPSPLDFCTDSIIRKKEHTLWYNRKELEHKKTQRIAKGIRRWENFCALSPRKISWRSFIFHLNPTITLEATFTLVLYSLYSKPSPPQNITSPSTRRHWSKFTRICRPLLNRDSI